MTLNLQTILKAPRIPDSQLTNIKMPFLANDSDHTTNGKSIYRQPKKMNSWMLNKGISDEAENPHIYS